MMKKVLVNEDTIKLLDSFANRKKAVTFDEITIEDKPSNVHPNNVNLGTWITNKIKLKGCGILSAAMDTVTEGELAVALAKMGGMGVIHRNMTVDEQVDIIKWVRHKIHHGGMIETPITYLGTDRLSQIQKDIHDRGYTFTSFPIVDDDNKLMGLITRDEMEFTEDSNPQLSNLMKSLDKIIVGKPKRGINGNIPLTTDEAYDMMKTNRLKKLPIIDRDGKLLGMYVWNDIKRMKDKENLFSLDSEGHFLVGAAIGVGNDGFRRGSILVDNGCKVLVIDTSHGACDVAIDALTKLRIKYGESIDIIIGNIASYRSAKYILDQKYKPNAIKVGISVGSICTTRLVTGHGMPQITAVYEVWKAINESGCNIPIIVDGGIRYSGDIVKALAVGASGFMMGGVFGAADESPGRVIIKNGIKYKTIRGMASRSAMSEKSGSRGRYFGKKRKYDILTTNQKQKITPEGVDGLVKGRGSVEDIMYEFIGGIRAGLAHSGAKNVEEFRENVGLWVQSSAGIVEAKPHDIIDIRN